MKISKVIEKFHFKIELEEEDAELLLNILQQINPNSRKHINVNGADIVDGWRKQLIEAGVRTSDDIINGKLTFTEF